MRAFRTLALVTAPPLLLAVAGLLHPRLLLADTAQRWETMHIVLLPVFPLLTLGLLVPLGRPARDLAGYATVVAWAAAFVYATFYTGLDTVSGIAAGTAARHAPPGTDLGPRVFPLFDTGDTLGAVGAGAFLVAALATSVALLLRYGTRVLPGAAILLVAGASFLTSHIFWPRGVLTMLAIAAGFALLAWPVVTAPRTAPGGPG